MTDYLELDLQLFAEDKKEPATPRRRQMAREKGQIFSSQDLVSAVSVFFAVIALRLGFQHTSDLIAKRSVEIWSSLPPPEPTIGWAVAVLRDVFGLAATASAPVVAAAALFAFGASVAQVGLNFRPALLAPDLARINPLAGMARLFSRRSLETCLRSLVKVAIVSFLAWNTLRRVWPELSALVIRDLVSSLGLIKEVLEKVLLNCSVFLVFTGILDYVYQWWEYEKSLMMTPREIKDEMKDTEGKPEVKAAIRSRQRQLARRRMMQEVPKADVVVVNPTHYAVALRYKIESDPAPVVVAKGLDDLALRIRRIAEESGVYVVEDPPLAQALYRAADVGEMIPEELYQAVAEVLAYVYRLSGKTPLEGSLR
ncbi:MAG TPA: flagellar biosynthesis protein FlhB [Firmicutes bacterium]|nr:flagellar biosynthesis protein FlhB [Candidatus Fermentithermobacillaceae bacterium]